MMTADLNDYTIVALKALAKKLKVSYSQRDKEKLTSDLTEELNRNKGIYASDPNYKKYYRYEEDLICSTDPLRERNGAVVYVHVLILAIEAVGLACNVRWASATTMPTINHDYKPTTWGIVSGTRAQIIFKILEPCVIWSMTSWILPLISAYLFSTMDVSVERFARPYPISPFAFSLVKLILAHVAYGQPALHNTADQACRLFCGKVWPWNLFPHSTFQVVRNSVPGGYDGLQLGAMVGVIVSIYDTIRETQRTLVLGR